MKIIQTDNFDRDYIPDKLIATNVATWWANHIVKLLNKEADPNGREFYRAVPQNYELKEVEL